MSRDLIVNESFRPVWRAGFANTMLLAGTIGSTLAYQAMMDLGANLVLRLAAGLVVMLSFMNLYRRYTARVCVSDRELRIVRTLDTLEFALKDIDHVGILHGSTGLSLKIMRRDRRSTSGWIACWGTNRGSPEKSAVWLKDELEAQGVKVRVARR
jgi:hypothetical protein